MACKLICSITRARELGCVLYTLCFFKHPFVDGQKLGISQAQYTIPNQSTYSAKLMDLIRHMLTPDPVCRPSSLDVLNILINWNRIQQIPLNVTFMFTRHWRIHFVGEPVIPPHSPGPRPTPH